MSWCQMVFVSGRREAEQRWLPCEEVAVNGRGKGITSRRAGFRVDGLETFGAAPDRGGSAAASQSRPSTCDPRDLQRDGRAGRKGAIAFNCTTRLLLPQVSAIMAAPRESKSPSPIPSTETNQGDGATATVTDEEWKAMQTVLNSVYAYRHKDGYDPTKIFQRKVNKRAVPDYYNIIKEPMALSTIKAKINAREYRNFSEFVRDFALVPHNAQVYNRPESEAYQNALDVRAFLEKELKKLVDQQIIPEEVAKLPFLGDIPPQDDVPVVEEAEAEEEEEDEDEDDEDEEQEDSDEEGGKRKRRKGARSTAAIAKREGGGKDEKKTDDPESRKKRGRPPRVDTPMEARIKAIMKGIRKPRNSQNQLMVSHFERLPDKAVMPEYYNEIKQPMAMDIIKRKLKRKKYQSVEQFTKDVELMFENAKMYNTDESQIYKDAVHLQKEARIVAEQEKKKPDTDYVMEDGRLPMPNGILHNGELWRVGQSSYGLSASIKIH